LLDVSKITTDGDTAATGIGIAVSPADDNEDIFPSMAAKIRYVLRYHDERIRFMLISMRVINLLQMSRQARQMPI
jgi:hypothetical protein